MAKHGSKDPSADRLTRRGFLGQIGRGTVAGGVAATLLDEAEAASQT